jgi:hypothetical protein
MSQLFYDDLIVLDEVDAVIKKTASSKEEREELWGLVDEILNHKVLETILDELPKESHGEFLELFHKCPHDEVVIFGYLKKKTGQNMEEKLRGKLRDIGTDILRDLNLRTKYRQRQKFPRSNSPKTIPRNHF